MNKKIIKSKIKLQSDRSGCKDVFKAFLVKNANYEGYLEIPVIKGIKDIPNKIISFIDAVKSSTKDFNQWVHFYDLPFLLIISHILLPY